jgi:hypothetical protein
MKKLTCLSALLCMLFTGCAQDTNKPETAKPFDLEEPEITPTAADEGSLEREYSPGELAWAKPDHKVVVHLLDESETAARRHEPCCEDKMAWHHSAGNTARIIGGETFHAMEFPGKDNIKRYVSGGFSDEIEALLSNQNQSSFQGIYFPDQMELDDAPTLHLFQCLGNDVRRYDLGDIHFVCGGKIIAAPEVKVDGDAGRWLACERERLWRTYIFNGHERARGNRFTNQVPGWCEGKLEEQVHRVWEGAIIVDDNIVNPPKNHVLQFRAFPDAVETMYDPFQSYSTPEGRVRTGPEIPSKGVVLGFFRIIDTEESTRR